MNFKHEMKSSTKARQAREGSSHPSYTAAESLHFTLAGSSQFGDLLLTVLIMKLENTNEDDNTTLIWTP